MLEIPDLEDYDVSPKNGFLPTEYPLTKLPDVYYAQWEQLAESLPSLILTKRVRSIIDTRLPLLETTRLASMREVRRAYTVLGFLSHAYIWGNEHPVNRLPVQLATPLLEVSEKLGLPPLATYAGLCLWNFKEIFPGEPGAEMQLDNLTTINTFSGSIDESWFYLVSVYFEYKGASCITTGLDAIRAADADNLPLVIANLQKMAQSIDKLGSVLMKMEEMCDPHVFYFRIRPFLAGWKNMASVGLENGVYYGDETTPREYAGGSNGQSTLIQALDLLLNVNHYGTGDATSNNAFMTEMRNYMPRKHREFLDRLSQCNNIREFVLSKQNPELSLSYDACLAMLKAFRDKHIQIVTRYIILQAQKSKNMGSSGSRTLRSGLARSKPKEAKGTGGTALLPFLKQCRDETGNSAAGNWGKRILTDGMLRLSVKEPEEEEDTGVIGLAGNWTDDKSNLKKGHW